MVSSPVPQVCGRLVPAGEQAIEKNDENKAAQMRLICGGIVAQCETVLTEGSMQPSCAGVNSP